MREDSCFAHSSISVGNINLGASRRRHTPRARRQYALSEAARVSRVRKCRDDRWTISAALAPVSWIGRVSRSSSRSCALVQSVRSTASRRHGSLAMAATGTISSICVRWSVRWSSTAMAPTILAWSTIACYSVSKGRCRSTS
jgi:hypothetical protein